MLLSRTELRKSMIVVRFFPDRSFTCLRMKAFFNAVHVDSGGYGISWNDDIDLSEYELWTNGQEALVETMTVKKSYEKDFSTQKDAII